MIRRQLLLAVGVGLGLASGACSTRVDVGSSVLWFAQHETGDFTEWTAASRGGYQADTPDTSVVIATDVARSGTYSVRLSNAAPSMYESAQLWREDDFPTPAYFSAWYFLPQAYLTTADWTIMRFEVPASPDAGGTSFLLDIDLRSLSTGEMILDIFDHRAAYLRSPTAEPALPVPIGRWFQIEVLYDNVGDDRGRLTLWLDGQINYDIQRPFGVSSRTYWSPCSSVEGLSPTSSELYVDDAAVSLVRIGPTGSLN